MQKLEHNSSGKGIIEQVHFKHLFYQIQTSQSTNTNLIENFVQHNQFNSYLYKVIIFIQNCKIQTEKN